MDILKLFAEVSGLSVFILALVEQIKRFGVTGKPLEFAAYGAGLVVGGLYRFFVYSPSTPLEWFYLALFGMGGGFIATGVYTATRSAMTAGILRADESYLIDIDEIEDIDE